MYDALNVLMAMNIISKEKKEIRWIGLPTNSAQECQNLEVSQCIYIGCYSLTKVRFKCFAIKASAWLKIETCGPILLRNARSGVTVVHKHWGLLNIVHKHGEVLNLVLKHRN